MNDYGICVFAMSAAATSVGEIVGDDILGAVIILMVVAAPAGVMYGVGRIAGLAGWSLLCLMLGALTVVFAMLGEASPLTPWLAMLLIALGVWCLATSIKATGRGLSVLAPSIAELVALLLLFAGSIVAIALFGHAGALLAAALGTAVLWLGVRIRRRFQPDVEGLMRLDRRPMVLYLRSFEADRLDVHEEPPLLKRAFTFLRGESTRFEPILVEQLRRVGPVVAIGQPGEESDLPPLGAAREYVHDAGWQERVASLVEAASAIVMVAGGTEGLAWEIRCVVAAQAARKLIVVVPPSLMLDDKLRRWEGFTSVARASGLMLPAHLVPPRPLGDEMARLGALVALTFGTPDTCRTVELLDSEAPTVCAHVTRSSCRGIIAQKAPPVPTTAPTEADQRDFAAALQQARTAIDHQDAVAAAAALLRHTPDEGLVAALRQSPWPLRATIALLFAMAVAGLVAGAVFAVVVLAIGVAALLMGSTAARRLFVAASWMALAGATIALAEHFVPGLASPRLAVEGLPMLLVATGLALLLMLLRHVDVEDWLLRRGFLIREETHGDVESGATVGGTISSVEARR